MDATTQIFWTWHFWVLLAGEGYLLFIAAPALMLPSRVDQRLSVLALLAAVICISTSILKVREIELWEQKFQMAPAVPSEILNIEQRRASKSGFLTRADVMLPNGEQKSVLMIYCGKMAMSLKRGDIFPVRQADDGEVLSDACYDGSKHWYFARFATTLFGLLLYAIAMIYFCYAWCRRRRYLQSVHALVASELV